MSAIPDNSSDESQARSLNRSMISVSSTDFKSPAERLNSDCLHIIFSYLSPHELIAIERVCRRWREVSLNSWTKVKTLNFPSLVGQLQLENLQGLLQRCGSYITFLNLSFMAVGTSAREALILIDKYSKCLTKLGLSHLQFQNGDLTLISDDKTKNLIWLSIRNCISLTDPILKPFLLKAFNLETLIVHDNNGFHGKSLQYLTKKCRTLVLKEAGIWTGDDDLRMEVASQIVKGINPEMTRLELTTAHGMTAEILAPVTKNLVYFSLVDAACSDEFFDSKDRMTGNGYFSLNKFTNLKCLVLNNARIKSHVFKRIAGNSKGKFEVVECRRCKRLDEDSLCRMIAVSPRLKEFDVSSVWEISVDFLEFASKSVKKRVDESPLTLYIELGGCNRYGEPLRYCEDQARFRSFEEDHGKNPLLNLVFKPRCENSSEHGI